MFLAADIGNSNIVLAIHDGNSWIKKFRYESKKFQPNYFYETAIRDLLLEWEIANSEIKKATISSVVPHLTPIIDQAIESNLRFKPLILGPEVFKRLDLNIPKVYEIGSDLVANAYAVYKTLNKKSIILDFGTALTFTVYLPENGIEGVTIAPGLKTYISSLSGQTAQLPEIELEVPKSAIGKSTSTAINAGVVIGFTGMVKEILSKIKSEVGEDAIVIATGGLSTVIHGITKDFDKLDKDLTLEGIRLISKAIDH